MSEGHWLVTLLKLKFRTTNQFTIVVMEVNEVASSYGGEVDQCLIWQYDVEKLKTLDDSSYKT